MVRKINKIEVERVENGWELEIRYEGVYSNQKYIFANKTDLIAKLLQII